MPSRARPILIDEQGARWAYDLGRLDRMNPEYSIGMSIQDVHPFVERAPHRKYWRLGWEGREFLWPIPTVSRGSRS